MRARSLLPAAAMAACLSLVASAAAAAPSYTRLGGADRYQTAALISADAFPDGADEVFVVNGLGFADALAAAGVAGDAFAPVLPVKVDTVPQAVVEEVKRLGATSATILGGPTIVSPAVESQLETMGLTVERVAGADRYETAADLATTRFGGSGLPAVVASGATFADALAGGSLGLPLLLTKPGALPAATSAALDAIEGNEVFLLGGTGAVSSDVEKALVAKGLTVQRLGGADRYATAAAVSEFWFADAALYSGTYSLASGADFADALAGGPAAYVTGLIGAPLLLTKPHCMPAATKAEIDRLEQGVEGSSTVLGGKAAVSDAAASRQPC